MATHSCLEDSSAWGQKVTTEMRLKIDSVKMKHLSQRDCLKDAIDLPPFSLDGQRSELFFLEKGGEQQRGNVWLPTLVCLLGFAGK